MQAYQLVPGGTNVLARRAPLRAPPRPARDPTLTPLKILGKSARGEVGPDFFALSGGLRTVVMVVGEGTDDAGAQFVRLGMGQFQRRHLLEMVVQQPRMIDQGLQNQCLAARDRTALATHDRAQRKLRARRLIGPAVDGLAPGRALRAAGLQASRRAADITSSIAPRPPERARSSGS